MGAYTAYYAVIILLDNLRTKSNSAAVEHELTFIEDVQPTKSYLEYEQTPSKESAMIFSGGVNLKQLFNLAREESVEYIKAVSF